MEAVIIQGTQGMVAGEEEQDNMTVTNTSEDKAESDGHQLHRAP